MRKIKIILTLFFALFVGIFCLHILSPKNAHWLKIESPSGAVQNQHFRIRITILKPEPGMYLGADLHWMTDEKVSQGYLSGCRPVKISGDKTVYELSIPVRKEELAGFVFPVVFISSDGKWNMHTKAAEAEPVPILKPNEKISFLPLGIKRTTDITASRKTLNQESVKLRFIAAGLWAAAALIALLSKNYLNTKIIAAAALISALWEGFNTSSFSGNAIRYIAWFIKAYNERREPQQITTILIIVFFALISLYLISSLYRKGKTIIWLSLLIFWTVSLLNILSLHEIDSLFSKTFAGYTAGQLIRLTASLVCLLAIMFRFSTAYRKSRTRPD